MPQILINREPLPHLHFDVELLGDCDVIINELCHRLGGEYAKLCCNPVKLSEITEKPPRTHKELVHLSELPPTPLHISEASSSPERTIPQDSSVITTLVDQATKNKVDDLEVSESKSCMEENSQEVQACRNVESINIENPDFKAVGSSTGEKNERTSVAEAVRKCWPNRLAKEQISKRLDGKECCLLNHFKFCDLRKRIPNVRFGLSHIHTRFSTVCVELEKGSMFIFAGSRVIQGFKQLGK